MKFGDFDSSFSYRDWKNSWKKNYKLNIIDNFGNHSTFISNYRPEYYIHFLREYQKNRKELFLISCSGTIFLFFVFLFFAPSHFMLVWAFFLLLPSVSIYLNYKKNYVPVEYSVPCDDFTYEVEKFLKDNGIDMYCFISSKSEKNQSFLTFKNEKDAVLFRIYNSE